MDFGALFVFLNEDASLVFVIFKPCFSLNSFAIFMNILPWSPVSFIWFHAI